MTGKEILALPMNPDTNDAGAATIRQYLVAIVRAVWTEGEGFSGKRPFGNGGWQNDLFESLVKAGAVEGKMDSEGYLDRVDNKAADAAILSAIEELLAEEQQPKQLDPDAKFMVHRITRSGLAEEINSLLRREKMTQVPEFTPGDPRLTDAICESYAMSLWDNDDGDPGEDDAILTELLEDELGIPIGWPWCSYCRSYHHPAGIPTCTKPKPSVGSIWSRN